MQMLIVPKDTLIYEPDDIHRVTLQFPTEEAAIIFYEWLREVVCRQSVEKPAS